MKHGVACHPWAGPARMARNPTLGPGHAAWKSKGGPGCRNIIRTTLCGPPRNSTGRVPVLLGIFSVAVNLRARTAPAGLAPPGPSGSLPPAGPQSCPPWHSAPLPGPGASIGEIDDALGQGQGGVLKQMASARKRARRVRWGRERSAGEPMGGLVGLSWLSPKVFRSGLIEPGPFDLISPRLPPLQQRPQE